MNKENKKYLVRKVNGILQFETTTSAVEFWDEYIEVTKEEYIDYILSCDSLKQINKIKTLN